MVAQLIATALGEHASREGRRGGTYLTDATIWDRMVGVMREVFDDPGLDVSRATTARNVAAWDSLANVELLVALQSTFRVRFTTGEMSMLRNAGELADVIAAKVRGERR